MRDEEQYYPTPRWVARKMWDRLPGDYLWRSDRQILDPSAGEGELLEPRLGRRGGEGLYAVEVNPRRQVALREKGVTVIGDDFLSLSTPLRFNAVIMNPPYRNGTDHVLYAYSLLKEWGGHLVALLPVSQYERDARKGESLRSIFREDGVETLVVEFINPDINYKTTLEVAILHAEIPARKRVFLDLDFSIMDKAERTEEFGAGTGSAREVGIPLSEMEARVRIYEATVSAIEEKYSAEYRLQHYQKVLSSNFSSEELRSMFGEGQCGIDREVGADLAGNMNKEIKRARDLAWRSMLRLNSIKDAYGPSIQEMLEKELEKLIDCEFTSDNIQRILDALVQSKPELDMTMLENAFDLVTAYGTNTSLKFLGWKSNDVHRLGMRIRPRRFILPIGDSVFPEKLSYEGRRVVDELQWVMEYLDGKRPRGDLADRLMGMPGFSSRQRVKTEYFDFRYFPGSGTLHVFPSRPDLIERWNRLVGKRRQWLPEDTDTAPKEFWEQMEGPVAEEFSENTWLHAEPERLEFELRKACEKTGATPWVDLLGIESKSPHNPKSLSLFG